MANDLNVALLGFGLAGSVFHAPLVAATPGLRLHSVVSRDAGKVHAAHPQACVRDDPAGAFAAPDIDVVVVATPMRRWPLPRPPPASPWWWTSRSRWTWSRPGR